MQTSVQGGRVPGEFDRTGERQAPGEEGSRSSDWPVPRTKTQVKSFRGLVGYYSRFIPTFVAVASPLTDLTRARLPKTVKWTDKTEVAFRRLKEALCSHPILVTPDFQVPMLVQTDACDTGLGGVLSQIHDGKEHPIIY